MASYVFFPQLRGKMIRDKLAACGAVSEETAKTLAEAGVFNPNGFRGVTEKQVKDKKIAKTADGRYYAL